MDFLSCSQSVPQRFQDLPGLFAAFIHAVGAVAMFVGRERRFDAIRLPTVEY